MPETDRDNLNNTSYAEIIDLISEGEIEGFATPSAAGMTRDTAEYNLALLKDIYLNNTQILTQTETVRTGTYTQSGGNIVVTFANHRFAVGQKISLWINSGAAAGAGELRTVTSVTSNTFTLAASGASTASGSCAFVRGSAYNFVGATVRTRYGTRTQRVMVLPTGSGYVSNEVPVNEVIERDYPIVRMITDESVDTVRVTIAVPQLQQFDSDGDIRGQSFQFAIDVQYDGGPWSSVRNSPFTVKGRTADLYQRDYMITLDEDANYPVGIRVRRLSADSTNPKYINAFTWSSYTEITSRRLRYPHSALVGMRVNAEQFNSIPTRAYLIRGRKIKLPSNAEVNLSSGRVTYTGVWDGTFAAAEQWCSDPAWILYDLLLSKRYGFGDHVTAASLDKWAFYSASQYCNELVPTGFGGTEPRFSCNVNIQTSEEAFKLINDLCSVFRAMPYWSTGALTLGQDRPASPAYLFTLANVDEAGFTYTGSDTRVRPTVALVSYLDLDTREISYEQVEDRAAIAKYGVQTTQISAFACTSRGQANRIGEWLLYSAQYETEVVKFTASIDAGTVVRPGQIIEIADPVRAGVRRGGRIAAATTTTITVDSATDLPGSGGTVSVIMKDGTVQSRTMTGRSGTVITLSSALTAAPGVNSVWVYSGGGAQTSQWRVIAVEEEDGLRYGVTALSYNGSKYAYVERDRPLAFRDVTQLDQVPAAPTGLKLSETLYTYQAEVRAKVIANWQPRSGVNYYRVRWRKGNGNWNTVTVQGPDYEILNISPGEFDLEIYSLSATGKASSSALTGTINALGKTAPPSNVTGLTAVIDKDLGVTLSWTPVTDLDLKDYEIRSGGNNWEDSSFLAYVKTSRYVLGLLDPSTTVYRVKARDTSNVVSQTAASRTVTITPPGAPSVSFSIEDPVAAITWTTPTGSYTPDYYELRYGGTFGAGTSVARVYGNSFNVPITWTGSRTFWVAGVDPAGNTGTAGSVVVATTAAAAPSVSAAFYGRTCALTWNPVSGSLRTVFYEIRQGSTWAAATKVAKISSDGTGYSLDASWSGARTFWVAAVDAVGNYGTPGSVVATVVPAPAPSLSTAFNGGEVQISWQPVRGTLEVAYYEVRRGSTFATATLQGRVNATYFAKIVDWGQSERFWVVAVDINGLYSGSSGYGTEVSVDIVVPAPSQPTITQQVVDNNVLLRWTDCTTVLPVNTFELRRGATWETAAVIGTKSGLFTTVFETVAGSFKYWLAAIDTAGNYGTPGSVVASVNHPPDYVLKLDQNSTFSGTKVNAKLDAGILTLGLDLTETYQDHFTSRSWTTPQQQINAGFPRWVMPSTTSASYEEIVDYGAVVPSSKVAQVLTSTVVAGAFSVTPKISVRKLTTDAWTDYAGVDQVYTTDFRYIKFRYDFSSSGGDDLMELTSLNYRLDSKLRNDFGTATANAGDTGGTTVNFTINFVDVEAISVTPSGTVPRIAIYDFVDAPNPTSFKVLLFDTSGNRVSGAFSWSARGV
jgi:predicted phage tail protein